MSKMTDALKVVLADTFAFYLKIHNYHWNVTGPDFYEYHIFFEKLYTEVFEAVDSVAEHIRSLDEYAPGSLSRFSELTTIADAKTVPEGLNMAKQLLNDNAKVIESLKNAYLIAEEMQEIGVSNFLQDRTDIHKKHAWMLRATIKDRI